MPAKRKLPTNLALPVVKPSAKPVSAIRIDESKAAVSTGDSLHPHADGPAETIEISSDSSSDYGDVQDDEEMPSDDEAAEEGKQIDEAEPTARTANAAPTKDAVDTEMASPDAEDQDPDASDAEAPTFGDLLRGSTTVDVPASLAAQQSLSLALSGGAPSHQVVPASLSSLGTVLNQALRTDDTELLETCLVINDVDVIQKTIDRLDSALAGVLLRKLTARMHRRPGRAFGLMRWMQWTLVAHGGALTSQHDIVKDLSGLNRVLDERARGLPSLLALKGKLDMQDSQLKMHRFHQKIGRSAASRPDGDEEEDSDDEAVDENIVYVENEEHEPANRLHAVRHALDAEDDFPLANGADDDDDEEEDSDEDDDDEAAVDVLGAEEDEFDEDEIDHDDVEESGEEDDSDADVPPTKLQKTAKRFSKRK